MPSQGVRTPWHLMFYFLDCLSLLILTFIIPDAPPTAPRTGMLAVFREDIIMDDSTKYEDDPVPEVSTQPPIGV